MIPLQITLDLEVNPWRDLKGKTKDEDLAKVTRIGRLPKGMDSGKSSIAIVIKTEDGREFVAETSLALFLAAARAIKACEDEMNGENAKN